MSEVPKTEGAVEFSNSSEQLKLFACRRNCHLVFVSSLNSWHHFLMNTGVPSNCCLYTDNVLRLQPTDTRAYM